MNLQEAIVQAAGLAVAGVITVSAGYYLIRNDLKTWLSAKQEGGKSDPASSLLPLRLQAHERLIVFIERINPANLFIRLYYQGISVRELQALILNEIRAEYQHNITQQLYIDTQTWEVVRKLKDDTLAMVNHAVEGLPADATGVDLSKKVLQHMAGITANPYDLTLDLIKKNIHRLF